MGQLFTVQVLLYPGLALAWVLHAGYAFSLMEAVAVGAAFGAVLALTWWYSPLPNASQFGTGRLTGGGYWGFKKNDE